MLASHIRVIADEPPAAERVVLLSEATWRRAVIALRLAGDPKPPSFRSGVLSTKGHPQFRAGRIEVDGYDVTLVATNARRLVVVNVRAAATGGSRWSGHFWLAPLKPKGSVMLHQEGRTTVMSGSHNRQSWTEPDWWRFMPWGRATGVLPPTVAVLDPAGLRTGLETLDATRATTNVARISTMVRGSRLVVDARGSVVRVPVGAARKMLPAHVSVDGLWAATEIFPEPFRLGRVDEEVWFYDDEVRFIVPALRGWEKVK